MLVDPALPAADEPQAGTPARWRAVLSIKDFKRPEKMLGYIEPVLCPGLL